MQVRVLHHPPNYKRYCAMNGIETSIHFNEALLILEQILQENKDILYRLRYEDNVLVCEPSHTRN